MLERTRHVPRLPVTAIPLLAVLPLGPLSLALGLMARHIATTHPRLFLRLGEASGKRFAFEPTDLPMVFILNPRIGSPELTARRRTPDGIDCRISGPIVALLGLVHGLYDGDALFFSRDIAIEGDTAAAVALRNAIDNAELDLFSEAAAFLGPLGHLVRPLVSQMERQTGIALQRPEP